MATFSESAVSEDHSLVEPDSIPKTFIALYFRKCRLFHFLSFFELLPLLTLVVEAFASYTTRLNGVARRLLYEALSIQVFNPCIVVNPTSLVQAWVHTFYEVRGMSSEELYQVHSRRKLDCTLVKYV